MSCCLLPVSYVLISFNLKLFADLLGRIKEYQQVIMVNLLLSRAVVLNLFYSATHLAIRHNQITHFQYCKSLNTHKCSCASGEELKKRRCPIFHPKSSEEPKKKVITSADIHVSTKNQVKSKKKVITSADVQISAKNQVKSKNKSSSPQMSKSRPPGS